MMSDLLRLQREVGNEIIGAHGMVMGTDTPGDGIGAGDDAVLARPVDLRRHRPGAAQHHRRACARPAEGAGTREGHAVQASCSSATEQPRSREHRPRAAVDGAGSDASRRCSRGCAASTTVRSPCSRAGERHRVPEPGDDDAARGRRDRHRAGADRSDGERHADARGRRTWRSKPRRSTCCRADASCSASASAAATRTTARWSSRSRARHARLDEQVAIMRRVWAGEPPVDGVGPVGSRAGAAGWSARAGRRDGAEVDGACRPLGRRARRLRRRRRPRRRSTPGSGSFETAWADAGRDRLAVPADVVLVRTRRRCRRTGPGVRVPLPADLRRPCRGRPWRSSSP